MQRRNMLYTPETRGKQLEILVGTRRALRLSVANDRAPVRRTALARRLRDE